MITIPLYIDKYIKLKDFRNKLIVKKLPTIYNYI